MIRAGLSIIFAASMIRIVGFLLQTPAQPALAKERIKKYTHNN